MGSTCGWKLQSLVFEALRTPGIGRTLLIDWFAAALSPEALLSPRMRSLPSGIGGGSGSGKDKKKKKKQKKDDKKKDGQGDEGQDDAAGSPGECPARKGCYGQSRAGTQATATCCITDSLPHHRQLPPCSCLSQSPLFCVSCRRHGCAGGRGFELGGRRGAGRPAELCTLCCNPFVLCICRCCLIGCACADASGAPA